MADESVPIDRNGEALVKHLTGFDELAVRPEDEGIEIVLDDENFGGVWGDNRGGWVVAVVDCDLVDADRLAALAGGATFLTLIEVPFSFEEINGFRDRLVSELRDVPEVAPDDDMAVIIDSTVTGRLIRVLVPDPNLLGADFGFTLPASTFVIERTEIDDPTAPVADVRWSTTATPELPASTLDDLTEAAISFREMQLHTAAGLGRVPLLIPPPPLADDSLTFASFANNPAENLMAYVHVFDLESPPSDDALSYLALHASLATDTARVYVSENASRVVQDHPVVVGEDSRATCGEVEEGGRDDTVLSWVDGDLVLSISVYPLPECETLEYIVADVVDWANGILWCAVDEEAAIDCVKRTDARAD